MCDCVCVTVCVCVPVFECLSQVELKEYVKLGQCVYAINKGDDGCSQVNFEPVRDIAGLSNSVSNSRFSKTFLSFSFFLLARKMSTNYRLLFTKSILLLASFSVLQRRIVKMLPACLHTVFQGDPFPPFISK